MMSKHDPPGRHSAFLHWPVPLLVLGLSMALVAIAGFGAYAIREIRELGEEQTAISDRNRKDSLQLLRIQNNLALLGTAMRDMADRTEPYPMTAWRGTFDRIRGDLDEALEIERSLAAATRDPEQQEWLDRAMAAYWATADQVFDLAAGDEASAAALIRSRLTQQHMELTGVISRFLVANNRVQEEAVRANEAIYARVIRGITTLVVALLAVVLAAGGLIIAASARAFGAIRDLTAQLRTLSWRTLRMQEDVQREVSRELHDDFGQIVTAIGALLGRAGRSLPADGARAQLEEVRGIAQGVLDRIRTRSQWLHPGVLDDFGLARALARYVEQFERQSGIRVRFTASDAIDALGDEPAIHVYRIVQEALSNVSRHSGSRDAWVHLTAADGWLELEVGDRGAGLDPAAARGGERGMGLVTMRERAELMGGELTLKRPRGAGLVVHVRVPLPSPAAPPVEPAAAPSPENASV